MPPPHTDHDVPSAVRDRDLPARRLVVVALSGGVDSSVAAALLLDQGFEVIGLSMRLHDPRDAAIGVEAAGSPEGLRDAARVAAALGIPHHIVDLRRPFADTVVDDFVRQYVSGRTPLPCARCNRQIKFAELVRQADALGASAVATGHYARTRVDERNGAVLLMRGLDPQKDQSYFLFLLTQAHLARTLFPLGGLEKTRVRELARSRRLPTAARPDSQEICFVSDGDHAAVIERAASGAARVGSIVDRQGRWLGEHAGVHRFTVGQRKGLHLAVGRPLYVIGIDAATHTVTVGERVELLRRTLTASQVNWIAGQAPAASIRATVQIRSRHRPAPATVSVLAPDRVLVQFDEPQSAITPGQAAVFFDHETLLGGGWIDDDTSQTE